jgi:phosphatidylethanolamine-binding protein (PEBP) family uncharacterized protein
VAQRTGAERFLAPLGTASARAVALALALAALGLVGCGGSSSQEGSTAQGTSSDAVAETSPGGGSSGSAGSAEAQSGEAAAKAPTAEGKSGSTGGAEPSGAQGGQKHGPRIARPKGPTEQAPTPAQISQATVADMSLESPAIVASAGHPGTLAATYTCDGADSWPELHWAGVPAGTAELILYAMSVQPVEEQLFVDWAVAGLDPGLAGIEAGKLPKGAVVGTNGFGKRGYEICPSGGGEIYMFAVYALPKALSPAQGFDARELRKAILEVSGNVGLLPAVYARG